MTEKANTSLVVSGYPAEFFYCFPNISPPPGGKWDFTFKPRLSERFFLPWDSGEGVGVFVELFQTLPLLKPHLLSCTEPSILNVIYSLF